MNRSLEIPNLVVTGEEDEGPFRVVHVRSIEPVAKVCNLGCRTTFNGWKTRDINDVPHYGKPTILQFHGRRFACPDCDRGEGLKKGNGGIYERIAFVAEGTWITKRCVEWMARECVRRTFAEVARSVGLDPQTASSAFKAYADEVARERRPIIPRVLGIDEIWLKDDYRAVLGDVENRLTLDMLLDRRETLERRLNELSEHREIDVVVTDRHEPYLGMMRRCLKGRLHVADHWHVVKYANDALDVVRVAVSKKMPNRRRAADLRMAKGLFHTRWHDLTLEQKHDLGDWFNEAKVLSDAYWAKEAFFDIYRCDTPAEAERAYYNWFRYLSAPIGPTFANICKVEPRWLPRVLAYFEEPYTTGFIESLNRFIADQDRDGRGYSFDMMRAKFLLREPLVDLTFRPKVHTGPMPRKNKDPEAKRQRMFQDAIVSSFIDPRGWRSTSLDLILALAKPLPNPPWMPRPHRKFDPAPTFLS
ncbi:MAG: ISL3 family transposase [Methylobacterium radiotolerans]